MIINVIKKLSIICIVFITSPFVTLAQFAGGNGTIADPYQIENPEQLDSVRNYLNMSFILNNDIDLNTAPYNTGEGWEPIGEDWRDPFIGSFNGNGHVILNLMINQPRGGCLGLFGNIGTDATIKNLGIYGNLIGYSIVGGLTGYNHGKINNCWFSGSVEGEAYIGGLVGDQMDGTITNCYANGLISGDSFVGGLVGYNSGTISDCNTANDVTGDDYVGGMVGYSDSKYSTNLHATGNVTGNSFVGGLIGSNDGTVVSNSYATGTVEGNDYSAYMGGLIGLSYGDTIINCYASGRVSGDYSTGGLVGYNYSSIIDCSTTNDVTGNDYIGGLVGYNGGEFTTNTHATGNISGRRYVGGLLGYNYGTLSRSYATGTVEGSDDGYYLGGLIGYSCCESVSDCYATGNLRITGFSSDIGGLIGYNYGNLSNCYAAGSISTTEPCEFLGGLVGNSNDKNIILNCFYNKETSGQNSGLGYGIQQIPGLSTEEMKEKVSYVDWDFNDTWSILEGKSYPGLKQIDNAPFGFRYSLPIHHKTLILPILENDYDVESVQTSLVVKIEKLYGSGTIDAEGWFEFPVNTEVNYTDSLRYRVGEVRSLLGDTLWGNTAIAILMNSNNPPAITSTASVTVTELTEYIYVVTATDPENDELNYTLQNAPEGMVINDNTIYWTPEKGVLTSGEVTLIVSDGYLSAKETFIITVEPSVITSTNITTGKKDGLLLYPNPVMSGEGFHLQVLNMDDVDLQGTTIMIFNSLGDLVYRSNEVKALNTLKFSNQTGFFIVRLTKADGKEFQGKLMISK